MINVQLQEAIAEKFIELYDSAFINPVSEYDNLLTLLREDDPLDPADDATDITFSFPQEQILFGTIDTVTSGAVFVGSEDANPADPVDDILGYFTNALTRIFPASSEILEIIPALGDDNRLALRVKQSGVGSQTGRHFDQSATIIITLDEAAVGALDEATVNALLNGETTEAKVISEVEFFSNAYPIHAAVLDSVTLLQPPAPPEGDPLTFEGPYRFDPAADPLSATEIATQVWGALAVGDVFTASALHAADAVWSFAIGGPSFLPYVGMAEGFTSDGQILAPDFSNLGAILTDILLPLGSVVAPGALSVVETFAEGNRVLVHLVEQTDMDADGVLEAPFIRETGTPYQAPLDIFSWFTIDNGQVVSNEVIVNSFATVNALREGEASPFSFSAANTRHSAPYFVTGSRVNSGILGFDEAGNFEGILFEGNAFDSPELQQPIGLTYGSDGYLYVNSTLGAQDNTPLINAVLRYDGVSGIYGDGTTPDNRESRDRARDAVEANQTPRLQNADPTRVADAPGDPADQPNDYNPALVGNAHGEYFDPQTGLLIDQGSLTLVPFDPNMGGAPNTLLARPFDLAANTLVDPNTNDIVYADGETGVLFAVPQGPLADVQPAAILSPTGALLAVFNGTDYINPANGQIVYTHDRVVDPANPTHITMTFTGVVTTSTAFTFDTVSDPRVIFEPDTGNPQGLAIPGLVIPSGVKFGPDGNLYVASAFTSRILQYDGVTGEFLSVFGTRDNGVPVANLLDPAAGLPPDFTVFVFGPDGGIYQASIRTDIDPTTGQPENGDLTAVDFSDGYGAVLRFPGPTWAKAPNGNYIDPLTGQEVVPGAPAGIATVNSDLTAFGVYGETGGITSQGVQPLAEPSAVAFGPDLNLYVASAQTQEVLRYAGPVNADGTPNPNAGQFLGVFADIDATIRGDRTEALVLSGMGFGPDGNLYVASSFENDQGAPTAGSQISVFVGPNPDAFGQAGLPGQFIDAYGDVTTDGSRLLLPTTPEFVYFENSYTQENVPSQRFPEMYFVAGVNTDHAMTFDTDGNPVLGFFQSDETDALAAYDRDLNFLGYLGGDLVDGELPQDVSGVDNPLDGVGGVIMGPGGDILVSSQLSDQVLRYSSLTGEYLGVFGDANEALLDFPAGLTLGHQNQAGVYVTDLGHGRILRFDGYTGAFLDDPATADVNEGIVAQLEPEKAGWRLTDLVYGPDGRLYVGLNPPFGEPAALGQAEVRAYNPETGALELQITGLDFAATLDFGPDNLLYIGDDTASLGLDPATGQPFVDPATGQFKESRIAIYEVDLVHPLLTGTDPMTGLPMGDPAGPRLPASLVRAFPVGFGNAGGMSLNQDEISGATLLFLSRPYSGDVVVYNAAGELLHELNPFDLPGAALPANGGVDENGVPRPTGSVFLSEFLTQNDLVAVSPLVPVVQAATLSVVENSARDTVVGMVTATDPDLDPVTFWIAGGNIDVDGDGRRAFALDGATGQVRVRDRGDLNFEETPVFNLTVVANDGQHDSAPVVLAIEVQDQNEAPIYHERFGNRLAVEDQAFSFKVPRGRFDDPDAGDQLAFSATRANGGALPAWLSFDPLTRTFTGTPADADVGVVHARVTATDMQGLSVNARFDITALNLVQGSDASEAINGGSRMDWVDGGGGVDTMAGGEGDDVYVVDNRRDVVREQADQGRDRIDSAVGYTLPANVEALRLTGGGSVDGTGNRLANSLGGNDGSNHLQGLGGKDRLRGGKGFDLLTGGAGADQFRFWSPNAGVDMITDFEAVDKVVVNAFGFGGGLTAGQPLAASQFVLGGAAGDADDRLIYDSAAGSLFFDADGSGPAAQTEFARLAPGTALTAANILVA